MSATRERTGRIAEQSETLRAAAADPAVALIYVPGARRYGCLYLEPGAVIPPEHLAMPPPGQHQVMLLYCRGIYFDPWSGWRFERELSGAADEFAAVQGYIPFSYEELPWADCAAMLPPFMNSEDWWLERLGTPIHFRLRNELWKDWDQDVQWCGWTESDWAEFRAEQSDYSPYRDPARPGLNRSLEKPPHLCEELQVIFAGPRYMFGYRPEDRAYGFRRLDLSKAADHQPLRLFETLFCPFCGSRLPESLTAERRRRLAALGHDPDGPQEDLPPAFRTDAWWKEAGL